MIFVSAPTAILLPPSPSFSPLSSSHLSPFPPHAPPLPLPSLGKESGGSGAPATGQSGGEGGPLPPLGVPAAPQHRCTTSECCLNVG